MVYVDNFSDATGRNFGRMKMSHMVADTRSELFEMCKKIGVQTKWVQEFGTIKEHFDICLSKKRLAVMYGAKEINMRELSEFTKNRDLNEYLTTKNNNHAQL